MSSEIKEMFASISGDYDKLNSVMSFGTHHKWRKKAVRLSKAQLGDRVLDCASGTGDFAIEFKRVVGDEGKVVATDFCEEMLEKLPSKLQNDNLDIEIKVADVLNLPFDDSEFDVASISFGIRNVDNPNKCIEEMARVTKKSGKVVIMETGKPQGILKPFYNFYSNRLFPLLGHFFANKKDAYTYLPKSITNFPYGEKFKKMMEETKKFKSIEVFPINLSTVYIYIGTVK